MTGDDPLCLCKLWLKTLTTMDLGGAGWNAASQIFRECVNAAELLLISCLSSSVCLPASLLSFALSAMPAPNLPCWPTRGLTWGAMQRIISLRKR